MELKKKKIDELNIELTMNVAAADYAEVERKKLADCRRRADFKGFRKGNVPMSLVQRVYGEQVLAESVNQVISEQLNKFIEDEKLHILGEPLSSEKQPEIEWKSGSDFTFVFDIATSPEVKVDVVKEDTINKYDITVSAKDKSEMVENLKKYYEGKKEEKSQEDIEKEVSERLEEDYRQESEWRLSKDIRDFYVKKAGIVLPEDFLKRWLLFANEGKVTKEDVDKEFPGFAEDFKWQLVRGSLMKAFSFEIKPEDIQEAAKAYVTYQYAMYGIGNVPEDAVAEAVKNIMQDQKQVERLAEQVEDQKVIAKIKETATIKSKKITSEKFRDLK
ncbi:MAG: trigger factor family protein [Bacteroidales bacterium]|nr:trigger factor family protein [Bacteroidales bacterium]